MLVELGYRALSRGNIVLENFICYLYVDGIYNAEGSLNFAEGFSEVAGRYLKVAKGLLNFAEGFSEVAVRYLKVAEGLLDFAEGTKVSKKNLILSV